jgi:hypothetical protein
LRAPRLAVMVGIDFSNRTMEICGSDQDGIDRFPLLP